METVQSSDNIRNPTKTSVRPDNDNRPRLDGPALSWGRSVFPDGATARIYQPCRSAMTSAKPRKDWRLVFERRTAPFIEPLMGYTGGRDTLTQVELNFPTLEAAIRYAERQGLNYVVQAAPPASQAKVTRQHASEKQAFPTWFGSGCSWLGSRQATAMAPAHRQRTYRRRFPSRRHSTPLRWRLWMTRCSHPTRNALCSRTGPGTST